MGLCGAAGSARPLALASAVPHPPCPPCTLPALWAPPRPLPQALKLYGEPWKDIFFDSAAVLTPCWVLAAPLVHEGRKLGAVLWLSSCRWVAVGVATTHGGNTTACVGGGSMGHQRLVQGRAKARPGARRASVWLVRWPHPNVEHLHVRLRRNNPPPFAPNPAPRVNSDVLMRTASSCASPIIHAVTRAVVLHTTPVAADSSLYGSRVTGPAGGHIPCGGGGGGGTLSANGAVQSFSALSSQHSSVLSRGRTGRQEETGQVGLVPSAGGTELSGVGTA